MTEHEAWKIYNFVTGRDEILTPVDYPGEPTQEWTDGWDWCMDHGYKSNPYDPGTSQWLE